MAGKPCPCLLGHECKDPISTLDLFPRGTEVDRADSNSFFVFPFLETLNPQCARLPVVDPSRFGGCFFSRERGRFSVFSTGFFALLCVAGVSKSTWKKMPVSCRDVGVQYRTAQCSSSSRRRCCYRPKASNRIESSRHAQDNNAKQSKAKKKKKKIVGDRPHRWTGTKKQRHKSRSKTRDCKRRLDRVEADQEKQSKNHEVRQRRWYFRLINRWTACREATEERPIGPPRQNAA